MSADSETFTVEWADEVCGSHRLYVQWDDSIDEVQISVTEDNRRTQVFTLTVAQASQLALLLARFAASHT